MSRHKKDHEKITAEQSKAMSAQEKAVLAAEKKG